MFKVGDFNVAESLGKRQADEASNGYLPHQKVYWPMHTIESRG